MMLAVVIKDYKIRCVKQYETPLRNKSTNLHLFIIHLPKEVALKLMHGFWEGNLKLIQQINSSQRFIFSVCQVASQILLMLVYYFLQQEKENTKWEGILCVMRGWGETIKYFSFDDEESTK